MSPFPSGACLFNRGHTFPICSWIAVLLSKTFCSLQTPCELYPAFLDVLPSSQPSVRLIWILHFCRQAHLTRNKSIAEQPGHNCMICRALTERLGYETITRATSPTTPLPFPLLPIALSVGNSETKLRGDTNDKPP